MKLHPVTTLLAIFALIFCSSAFAAKFTVAVSLQPYANIIQQIAGDIVDVVTLVPAGADPHTFEPKPSTLKEFAKASVYFSDGTGMDAAWLPRFKGVNKDVQVISLSRNIQLEKFEDDEDGDHDHHDHHDHHHEGFDPHVWTSPAKVQLIAGNLAAELIKLDPSNHLGYQAGLARLTMRIDEIDSRLKAAVAALPESRRSFIVFHPSYGYFAHDYGMKQLAIEVDGKEPKPRDLQKLIAQGKKEQVSIIFVQPQFSKRAAATIAKELNAVVQETDPLASDCLANTEKLLEAILKAAK